MNDSNQNQQSNNDLQDTQNLIDETAQVTDKSSPSTGSATDPDEETKNRIKNLGVVGTALMQSGASESTYLTNFFVAKESLVKFKEGIDKLNLDVPSKKGIDDLIEYLQKKIDKRMQSADNSGNSPDITH